MISRNSWLASICCTNTRKAEGACIGPSKYSGALGCTLTLCLLLFLAPCQLRCFVYLVVKEQDGSALYPPALLFLLFTMQYIPGLIHQAWILFSHSPWAPFCFPSISTSSHKLSTCIADSAILSHRENWVNFLDFQLSLQSFSKCYIWKTTKQTQKKALQEHSKKEPSVSSCHFANILEQRC